MDTNKENLLNGPQSTVGLSIFLLIAFVVLFLAGAMYALSSPQLAIVSRISSTASLAISEHPDIIDGERLFESAAAELYGMLDRYSRYVPADYFSQVDEEFSGAYSGIGVSIFSIPEGLVVAGVNPRGPSAGAGILLGDIIIKGDSISLAGKSTFEASLVLRGKAGENVTATILRPKRVLLEKGRKAEFIIDTLEIEITRGSVDLNHIPYCGVTSDKTIYLRVIDFESGIYNQFKDKLDSLLELYPNPSGIIVDVRGNPGGLLNEALDMVDLFLDEDILILGRKGRSYWDREEFYSDGSDVTNGIPLAIMIDKNSASAAEIFCGSLMYADRAILIGDTTFGKGLVQMYHRFADGSASRLTVSRYYFVGDVFLNKIDNGPIDSGSGIPPTIQYEFKKTSPLIRQLGMSMLFHRFVGFYQNELIEQSKNPVRTETFVLAFESFAKSNDFSLQSDLLLKAQELYLRAQLYLNNPRAHEVMLDIFNIAEESTAPDFELESEAIIRKLTSLAYERRDGVGEAFLKFSLARDSDILACEKILRETSASDDITKVN
ncbi:MAG: PDZ domain-containing protein [candidate division Zixibacteria bacterium]|nr:PDZ domain-containing protein [candidate division Zixibacteria bacterium]